jgi:competence protein ComEA
MGYPAAPKTLSEQIDEFLQAYKAPLILGSISLASIVSAVVLLIRSVQSARPIEFTEATTAGIFDSQTGEIVVDVGGAVARPGVYRLGFDARIDDAINAAGGLTTEADILAIEKSVNRAARLTDGAKLFLPKTQDRGGGSITGTGQTVGNVNPPSADSSQISINSASQSELETLNGVGPKTAEKIITNRPYLSVEDLVSKNILTRKIFEKLVNQLSL